MHVAFFFFIKLLCYMSSALHYESSQKVKCTLRSSSAEIVLIPAVIYCLTFALIIFSPSTTDYETAGCTMEISLDGVEG